VPPTHTKYNKAHREFYNGERERERERSPHKWDPKKIVFGV
jgi:hypothetical protein